MAIGSPIGAVPIGAMDGAQAVGLNFTPATGAITFAAYAPLVVMVIAPPRVSWVGAEVLHAGAAEGLVSWFGVEALTQPPTTDGRVSWLGAEVLNTGDPANAARLTWLGAEVLNTGAGSEARVSWIGVEVLAGILGDSGFVYLIC